MKWSSKFDATMSVAAESSRSGVDCLIIHFDHDILTCMQRGRGIPVPGGVPFQWSNRIVTCIGIKSVRSIHVRSRHHV